MRNRRDFMRLAAAAGAVSTAAAAPKTESPPRFRQGIGTASYMQRGYADRENRSEPRFSETMRFLEYCHERGAGGIQAGLSSIDASYTSKLHGRVDNYGMYMEVSARLPKDDSDISDFNKTVRAAKNAGASVIRTVMLGGRRYETFKDLESWKSFKQKSWKSLVLAEPVLRKRKLKLAIENHKDWRIDEMLDILKRISSEYIGVTIDTGNNVSLMEDPTEVARAFAPYARSVHLKDMAVEAYEDGFLMSEVPFGEGFLDLKGIVDAIREESPDVKFTLEMITRDPLKIPYFTDQYWATLDKLPGGDLAKMIDVVRKQGRTLPRVDHLSWDERFRIEEENNMKSLEYGRKHLGL